MPQSYVSFGTIGNLIRHAEGPLNLKVRLVLILSKEALGHGTGPSHVRGHVSTHSRSLTESTGAQFNTWACFVYTLCIQECV